MVSTEKIHQVDSNSPPSTVQLSWSEFLGSDQDSHDDPHPPPGDYGVYDPLDDPLARLRAMLARGAPTMVFAGYWYAEHWLKETHVYHRAGKAWWIYDVDAKVWRAIDSDDPSIIDRATVDRYLIADAMLRDGHVDLAKGLANEKVWEKNRAFRSDFMAALRTFLAGSPPAAEGHLVGTPDCVVNLRTGEKLPHSPTLGIRSLTAGRFCPEDAGPLRDFLRDHFVLVFAHDTLDQYVRLGALGMTGRAPARGSSIVMLVGGSGKGKGGGLNALAAAMGSLAESADAKWLENHGGAVDIDSVMAAVLEHRARFLGVDEIGGDTKLSESRMQRLSGNARLSARRPYGPRITGKVEAQLWATCVSVPRLAVGDGMGRRLAVLPVLGYMTEQDQDEEACESQPLMDAIVTLSALEAAAVYVKPYRRPRGSEQAVEEALADMDPVATWLESLPDSWHHTPMSRVLQAAQQQVDPDATETSWGRCVNASERWCSDRKRHGGRTSPKVSTLLLKHPPAPGKSSAAGSGGRGGPGSLLTSHRKREEGGKSYESPDHPDHPPSSCGVCGAVLASNGQCPQWDRHPDEGV